jgi:glycosyltransferase involved in cell wall biosynthesis
MERITSNTDWFIYVWLLSLFLVAIAKMVNENKFSEFVSISISKKYFLTAQREENYLFNLFNVLLFLVQIISMSLFLYLFLQHFSSASDRGFLDFIMIAVYLTGFVLLKFFFEKLIGFVVGLNEFVNQFNFIKLSYRNNISLYFVAFNVLLYLTDSLTKIHWFTFLAIYLILSVIGFIRMFNFFQKEIPPNIFYFILYLCALEIAPYAILYKLLVD